MTATDAILWLAFGFAGAELRDWRVTWGYLGVVAAGPVSFVLAFALHRSPPGWSVMAFVVLLAWMST